MRMFRHMPRVYGPEARAGHPCLVALLDPGQRVLPVRKGAPDLDQVARLELRVDVRRLDGGQQAAEPGDCDRRRRERRDRSPSRAVLRMRRLARTGTELDRRATARTAADLPAREPGGRIERSRQV